MAKMRQINKIIFTEQENFQSKINFTEQFLVVSQDYGPERGGGGFIYCIGSGLTPPG